MATTGGSGWELIPFSLPDVPESDTRDAEVVRDESLLPDAGHLADGPVEDEAEVIGPIPGQLVLPGFLDAEPPGVSGERPAPRLVHAAVGAGEQASRGVTTPTDITPEEAAAPDVSSAGWRSWLPVTSVAQAVAILAFVAVGVAAGVTWFGNPSDSSAAASATQPPAAAVDGQVAAGPSPEPEATSSLERTGESFSAAALAADSRPVAVGSVEGATGSSVTVIDNAPPVVPPAPDLPVAAGGAVLPLVEPTPTPTPHPLDSLLAFDQPVTPQSPPVYLTFDDGPDPNHTMELLDLLDEYDATATFFVLGRSAREYPTIMQAIANRGHAIGNHTWAHGDQVLQEDLTIVGSLGSTNAVVTDLTGVSPTCFRPPYGSMDERTAQVVWNQGYSVQLWEVDSRDYLSQDPIILATTVLAQVQPGDRVLFHDGGGERDGSVDAVRDVLEVLTERGVTFAALPDCDSSS